MYPALCYGAQREMWSSADAYAFSRRIDSGIHESDELICVFKNSDAQRSVYMPLRAESTIQVGTVLENVMDATDRITVSQSSKAAVQLEANSNKIYKVSESQVQATAPVTFYVHGGSTELGQNLYIVGDIFELGNWNTDRALGPAACPTYPTWSVTANLPVGETIEFKAIKRDVGAVVWESTANRSYTVPENGGAVSFAWSVEGETSLVPVKFTVNHAYTIWGENIYIAGSTPELGNWNTELAVGPALCPDYPTWTIFADVPAGQPIEWKAIKKGSSTDTIWQSGSNNLFTAPTSGTGAASTTWS